MPTRAWRSETGSGSPTRGPTGSPRGRATLPSRLAGCFTSRCSSTRATPSSGRSCWCSWAFGSRRASISVACRNMGWFQLVTTITKFAALVFMSIVGLFYIKSANFHPWNVSGHGAVSAIGSGMAIALFSYLGLETASVAAAKVRDPDRNVPLATMLGTLASAVVYMPVAHRGLRNRLQRRAAEVDGAVLDRRQHHVRRDLLGQRDGRGRDHLRDRRAQRLDDDHR